MLTIFSTYVSRARLSVNLTFWWKLSKFIQFYHSLFQRFIITILFILCKQVIDESYFVMHYVMKTPKPPRPHEILQELRDISSMAMEHFDEKIVPILKKKMPGVSSVPVVTTAGKVIGYKIGQRNNDNIFAWSKANGACQIIVFICESDECVV